MEPDFDHLEPVHLELGRIRNIRNLNLNQQLEDIRNIIHNGFRQINDTVRTFEMNMSSWLENSRVVHDNVALLPLRGVDNQLIPNFPVNISHLRRMDEMTLNGILTSLGVQLPQHGGIEIKRRMVARYIGLVVTL
ncbi:hypothetical protein EV426DRAFT_640386 [Tirmania nivea]|nr:hypothetical protein EV426DRAFT_640386 [Tirmania nivea]